MKKATLIALILCAVAATTFGDVQTKIVNDEWGTAIGISSCVSTTGCLKCGNRVDTGEAVCVRIKSAGNCQCKLTMDACYGSGACTYRP
jgi:hypothetical protein